SPLSLSEFSALLRPLPISATEPLAVAVSGGPDSLALLLLLHQWAPTRVHAIIVDHLLRPESTAEAAAVAQLIRDRGIPVTVKQIDWGNTPPSTIPTAQIEERARVHRYRLLAQACTDLGATKLFLGHHLNDQVETVMIRLARSSGLGGLGGMGHGLQNLPIINRPEDHQVKVIRPLLTVPKSKLVGVCKQMGIEYVVDRMNEDMSYQRNVVRDVLARTTAKAEEQAVASGKADDEWKYLTEESLTKFVEHMGEYASTANAFTNAILTKSVLTDHQTGSAFLHLPHLAKHPDHWFHHTHLATHVLGAIIRWIDCSPYPAPVGSVAMARDAMLAYYMHGLDPSAPPGTQQRWTPPPRVHEFKAVAVGKAIITPPRPDRNGPGNWAIVRSPPIASLRAKERLPLTSYADHVLFDARFFVQLAPATVDADDPRMNLADFYRSLASHLPFDPHAIRIRGIHPAVLGQPTHELIVRYLDREDEGALTNVFRMRHVHPAWSQYRRAWEHYKRKMPVVSRFVVPVVAIREIEGAAKAAAAQARNVHEVVVKPARAGVETKAKVGTPLGAVVAIPCLNIAFMPDVFAINVSYRNTLVRTATGGEES
ncbi:PP-loop family-domain-containing protein, partial [Catenaria anguillulae PL171]